MLITREILRTRDSHRIKDMIRWCRSKVSNIPSPSFFPVLLSPHRNMLICLAITSLQKNNIILTTTAK